MSIKLSYRIFGEGVPLVILHGLYGCSDYWITYGKKLTGLNYRVYIPDLRNHGTSPHEDEFNVEILVSDLENFLQEHKIEQSILMGHSLGGKIALHYALNRPNSLSGMIVLDMGLHAYSSKFAHNDLLNIMLSTDLQQFSNRKEIEDYLDFRVNQKQFVHFVVKNLLLKEGKYEWKINLKSIKENISRIFEPVPITQTFQAPTLFLTGDRSDYFTEEDKDLVKKHFPNHRVETVENAGHWLQVDNPEDFYRKLENFLLSSR